jgi:MFS family permease
LLAQVDITQYRGDVENEWCLAIVRGLAQAGAALLAGVSSSRVDRPILILAGCWTWGVGAAFIGVAPNFGCMLVAVALNGVGAGVLKPVLISMLADLAPVGGSGKTFSLYDFTNSVAGVLGATIATVIAPLDIPFIGGAWRLLFLALSAVAGLLGGETGPGHPGHLGHPVHATRCERHAHARSAASPWEPIWARRKDARRKRCGRKGRASGGSGVPRRGC